jgi:hypothetical protein
MRYDSVLLYMDNEQPSLSQYWLPSCCPGNPDNKIAQVQVPRKIGRMVDDDYTNKEDVAVNKAIEFNNCNNDDNDNDTDKDDNDDDDLYSKVSTAKKRKKEAMSKQMTLKKTMSKKAKSVAMTKHNNKSLHNNNTINNHDSVISCKGVANIEGDVDDKDDLFTFLLMVLSTTTKITKTMKSLYHINVGKSKEI